MNNKYADWDQWIQWPCVNKVGLDIRTHCPYEEGYNSEVYRDGEFHDVPSWWISTV